MSLLFAAMALYALLDLFQKPKEEIQFVLAHESQSGYRSTSKYGASHVRENFFYCIPFRSRIPNRLRGGNEIDTLLTFESIYVRRGEAETLWDSMQAIAQQNEKLQTASTQPIPTLRVAIDEKTYYDLEDGDSIRLFFSPWRNKIVGYTVFTWPRWLDMSFSEVSTTIKHLNPELNRWLLTTVVFALISLALSVLTWILKTFQYSVGLFVFNCVAAAMLHWFY